MTQAQYMLTVLYDDTSRQVFYADYSEAIEQFRDLQEELPGRADLKGVYLSIVIHQAEG
jgi:hypothetical protein